MEQLNMVCASLSSCGEPVAPAGSVLRTFQPGDEQAWADVVNTTDMGRPYDVSGVRESLTGDWRFDPAGLFFACDQRTGQPLATACAWWKDRFGRQRPMLHMVAARPEARGRGLGRLVCQAVMHYFRRRGQTEVVLTTDGHRVPAIASYLRLNWLPMRYVRGEDHAERWQSVFANLKGKCGPLRFAGRGAPVNIGVLGLRRGLDLVNQVCGHAAAKVVAGCDLSEPLRRRFLERFGQAGVQERYQALLDGPAEAVIVAHDCPDHAPAAIAALRAGKDVFSEVTAFHTPAQGVELVETAESAGRAYMMGENCLYENAMMELAWQTQAGKLGALQYAEGDYVHDCRYLLLRDGQRYWRSWYPPILYCTHALGPILRASGDRPARVVGLHAGRKMEGAQGGIDMAAMLIQTASGAVIRILSGFAVNREPASLWVCYYGTKASLETGRWDDQVHVFDKGNRGAFGPTSFKPTGQDGRPYTTAGHYGADTRTMEYWLESLVNGLAMPINVHEAADMTLPGILGYRSSLSGGQPLDVPDLCDKSARDAWRADRHRPDPADPTRMTDG